MKLFFILFFCLIILGGCGKKTEPKYQSKIKHIIKTIS